MHSDKGDILRSSLLQVCCFALVTSHCILLVDGEKRKRSNPNRLYNAQNHARLSKEFNDSGNWLRPELYAVAGIIVALIIVYFLRQLCLQFAPPETIAAVLDMDETRIERFHGIENTLYERLRDPWNYQPRQHMNQDEDEEKGLLQNDDNDDIRSSAELLKRKNVDFDDINEKVETDYWREKSILEQGKGAFNQSGSPERRKEDLLDDEVYSALDRDSREKMSMELTGKAKMGKSAEDLEKEKLLRKEEKKKLRKADREKMQQRGDDAALYDEGFDAQLDKDLKGGNETGQTAGGASTKSSGWDMWNDFKDGGSHIEDEDTDDPTSTSNNEGSLEEKSSFPLPPHMRGAQGAYHAKMAAEANQEDPRFASRKKGGYKAPGQQDKSRPPVTNPRLNAKAAGGSFSQGSGPLARQNTMAPKSPDDEDAYNSPLRISPDKKSLTLDVSKVNTPPQNIKIPDNKQGKPLPQQSLRTLVSNGPRGGPKKDVRPINLDGMFPGTSNQRASSKGSEDGSRPGSASTTSSHNRIIREQDVSIAPASIPKPGGRPNSSSSSRSGSSQESNARNNNTNTSNNDGWRRSTGFRSTGSSSNNSTAKENSLKIATGSTGFDDSGTYDMDIQRYDMDPLRSNRAPPGGTGTGHFSNSLQMNSPGRGSPGGGPPGSAKRAPPRVSAAVSAAVLNASQMSPDAYGSPGRGVPRAVPAMPRPGRPPPPRGVIRGVPSGRPPPRGSPPTYTAGSPPPGRAPPRGPRGPRGAISPPQFGAIARAPPGIKAPPGRAPISAAGGSLSQRGRPPPPGGQVPPGAGGPSPRRAPPRLGGNLGLNRPGTGRKED